MAEYIKQCKTPEEIRLRFNIPNDFTPEEVKALETNIYVYFGTGVLSADSLCIFACIACCFFNHLMCVCLYIYSLGGVRWATFRV